jgi:RNA polymerase sigma-70 factor, ECF subfamily
MQDKRHSGQPAQGRSAENGETAPLLDAARAGDEAAFARLVRPLRAGLHAHCYRMLGSLQDAEDALQEALLHAWQGLGRFEGNSSLRTWLFTIATHASLRLASRRPRRVVSSDVAPAADPSAPHAAALDQPWLEPFPDAALAEAADQAQPDARYEALESVELAFVAALQHLPATQRAVLILRDVLGFSADETSAALETSVPAVTSALQRARAALERLAPAMTQQATRRALGEHAHRQLVERFIDAWRRADIEAVVGLLADDATFTMPPLPTWYSGRDALRTFMLEKVFQNRWRFLPFRVSGQPTIVAYLWNDAAGTFKLAVLNLLTFRGDRVAAISAFLDDALLARFGLPPTWPGDS